VQPDGRLLVGERNGGGLPPMTIGRVWWRARQAAFTAEVAASPLAKTPYDRTRRGSPAARRAVAPPLRRVELAAEVYASGLTIEEHFGLAPPVTAS
jgi:hypothetical protein